MRRLLVAVDGFGTVPGVELVPTMLAPANPGVAPPAHDPGVTSEKLSVWLLSRSLAESGKSVCVFAAGSAGPLTVIVSSPSITASVGVEFAAVTTRITCLV